MHPSTAHGLMSSPRSRNLVAFEEKDHWLFGGPNEPESENCPHCLNKGGTLARCGMTQDRNYDVPKNSSGERMPLYIQATYEEGQEVLIESKLTAHHKGHFSVKACQLSPGEVPTQKCFDDHPLHFVKDKLYGAKPDKNYPERAYIAPSNHKEKVVDEKGISGMVFRHIFKLPKGLRGDFVLLQWHYLTANSCNPEGYDDYDWPKGKKTTWYNKQLPVCKNISKDGSGTPEQFWNCAEVSIRSRSGSSRDDSNASENYITTTTEQPENGVEDVDNSDEDNSDEGDLDEEVFSENFFCGRSQKQVDRKACTDRQALSPCQHGKNGECPRNQSCYEASQCSSTITASPNKRSNHFFCGTSWRDASNKCSSGNGVHCPNGNNEECPGKLRCWADMPCDATEDQRRALYLRGHTA